MGHHHSPGDAVSTIIRDQPRTEGAAELAAALGKDQHVPVLNGSFVIRKPRQALEADHASVSIRDGTFVPVPRIPDTARMLGLEIRRARDRVVKASTELRKLLGPAASRHAEDIGLLPTEAPLRGKVEFVPKRQQLLPGSARGAPALLPAMGIQLGVPASGAASGSADGSKQPSSISHGRQSEPMIEGTAGVPLSFPVPGGPVDRHIALQAEQYAAYVRQLDRSSGGIVRAGGSGSNLLVSTPEHLPEHRQIWQLDQQDGSEFVAEAQPPPRDSKLLEASPIPLEEQSLETSDVFMVPASPKATILQLSEGTLAIGGSQDGDSLSAPRIAHHVESHSESSAG